MTKIHLLNRRISRQAVSHLLSKERLREHLRTPLYANSYYLMANSVLAAPLGFAFWLIAARFYEASDVGLASAAISAIGLVMLISNLGLGAGLIRFLPNAGERSAAMVSTYLTIGGLVSLVAGVIFIAGLGVWSPALLFIRQHPVFLACFIIFAIMQTLAGILDQVFLAKRSAKYTFFRNITANLLKILIVVIMIGSFGTFGIFASAALSISIGALMAMFWFLPRVQKGYLPIPMVHREVLSSTISYSLKNYLAALLAYAPQMLFPIMVVNILGAEMNAYFYMPWAMANMLLFIPTAISLSLWAEGSHNEDRLVANAKRSLALCLLLLIPIILLILALGDKLLLLFGEAYSQNGTTLLWLLAISILPASINTIYFTVRRVRMDMRSVIWAAAVGSSVALGSSYVLMGTMGILGAGVGWFIGQSVVAGAVIFILFGRRRRSVSRLDIKPGG